MLKAKCKEFSAQNGATMFALGTAAKGTAPPAEWGALSMVNDIPEGGHQLAGPAGQLTLATHATVGHGVDVVAASHFAQSCQ